MKNRRLIFSVFTALFCLTTLTIKAEASEVTIQHKGLILNAWLELAGDSKLKDGVILITHGGLAHGRMEFVTYLQAQLKERGYNSLAITLSLGINKRQGMYECAVTHNHRHEDAVHEIGAWVTWLMKQGAPQAVLLGHSRGGSQSALYLSQHDSDFIKAAILMAPATSANGSESYQRRYKQALKPTLSKARRLASEGKGNSVIKNTNIMFCQDIPATADTFVSYFGHDELLDTPSLLTKIHKPVFVVVAGDDNVVVGLDKKLAPMVDGRKIQLTTVNGADHLFRDLNTDDAADEIDEFLNTLKP